MVDGVRMVLPETSSDRRRPRKLSGQGDPAQTACEARCKRMAALQCLVDSAAPDRAGKGWGTPSQCLGRKRQTLDGG